jgi:hypothetical protein
VAHEVEPLEILFPISAVPRPGARRGIEEALALVEPHRLHVHTRFAGKFANSHKVTLTL